MTSHNPTMAVAKAVAAKCTSPPLPIAPLMGDDLPLSRFRHDGASSFVNSMVAIVSKNACPEMSNPLCHLGLGILVRDRIEGCRKSLRSAKSSGWLEAVRAVLDEQKDAGKGNKNGEPVDDPFKKTAVLS